MVKFALQLNKKKKIYNVIPILIDQGYKYIGISNQIEYISGESIRTLEFKKILLNEQYHLFIYEKRKTTGKAVKNKKKYVVIFAHYEKVVKKGKKIFHSPESPLAERKIIEELNRITHIIEEKNIAKRSYKDRYSFNFTLKLNDYHKGIRILKDILKRLGYVYNPKKRKFEKFVSKNLYSTISVHVQQRKYLHFLITWGIISRIDKKNRLIYKKAKSIGKKIIKQMILKKAIKIDIDATDLNRMDVHIVQMMKK